MDAIPKTGPGINDEKVENDTGDKGAETEDIPTKDGVLLTRIHIPELCISKCLQFPKDQLIWDVKQQCLSSLPKELKESFNYGLFCPPVNGKAGKFLDEERRLGDYTFSGPVGYLELKYKRRVYKMLHLDEKQLKAVHTRTNLRRFLDYVTSNQIEKVSKMCSKGLDPNFHCSETGETPLTLATTLKKPSKIIIALINGGALLDYRTKEGFTAIHRAVERNNLEAVRTLLELGASPNYKDTKGLTPLYYSVIYKTDPMLCETLLHDHATIGAQDFQGWQEIHHACRNNLVQHLDHLLFYGADMNARNASGNTPLHICAVNNTDSSCTRQLLFRGAQKDSLNYANQTPYQVAVIAGNMELAEIIKSYQPEEVVPFKGPPHYNPKRRSIVFDGIITNYTPSNMNTLSRTQSISEANVYGTLIRTISIDEYSSAILNRLPIIDQYRTKPTICKNTSNKKYFVEEFNKMSSATSIDKMLIENCSPATLPHQKGLKELPQRAQTYCEFKNIKTLPTQQLNRIMKAQQVHRHSGINNFDQQMSAYRISNLQDIRSPTVEYYHNLKVQNHTEFRHRWDTDKEVEIPTSPSPSSRSFAPFSSASSSLSESSNPPSGEDSASIITDKSLGDTASDAVSDSSGVGTSQSDTTNSLTSPGTTVVCVESYNSGIAGHLIINQGDVLEVTGATDCGLLEGSYRGQGTGLFPAHCVQEVRLRHNITSNSQIIKDPYNRVSGHKEPQYKYFSTAPRLKKPVTSEPRAVVLHRSRKGFGFILRGAKTTPSNLSGLTPAAQYLDDVTPGGVADLAGLKKGDFLIQINGEDIASASHEHVVDMIRKSGELVRMTVVSPMISLPYSHSSVALPTSQPNQRQYATLPRKGSNTTPTTSTLGRSPAPMPPRRDPKTTLSVGRARARSMVAGLENGADKDDHEDVSSTGGKSSSAESIHLSQQPSTYPNTGQNTPVQPRTASIRSRPTSNRITAAELEELFQRQQGDMKKQNDSSMNNLQYRSDVKSHPTSPLKHNQTYASIAEIKRRSSSRTRLLEAARYGSDLHRDFHSTPNLNMQYRSSILAPKNHRSQGDVNSLLYRNGLPPPNHPPPPPPFGQIIKVNVGTSIPDVVTPASIYDNILHIQQIKELSANIDTHYGIMSSFRPSNNAKLYASPEDTKTVGYRAYNTLGNLSRTPLKKQFNSQTTDNVCAKMSNDHSSQSVTILSNTCDSISNTNNGNQYAQPMRTSRNYNISNNRESKANNIMTNSLYRSKVIGPPIPEPDYSLSESENEENDEVFSICESEITEGMERITARDKFESARETSDNSNTSGSSSSSSNSVPRSFSVEEIQKVRIQLKPSKSHPNEFLLSQPTQQLAEDGDNSSSGVSSDQDIPVGPSVGTDNVSKIDDSQLNVTDKDNVLKRINYSSGMLTRHAVSLAQLPPPIEADVEEQHNDLFVPPPPEFTAGPSSSANQESELVFAPPPQFCDSKQQIEQNRAKIVGTIPKVGNN